VDQKQNTKTQTGEKAATPQKSNNKVLFWILGGCLVLFVITGLVIGGIAYWSYKKVKKEIKENKPKLEQWENQMEKIKEDVENQKEQVQSTFEEEPQAVPSGGEAGMLPANSERQMGHIKKIYVKGGKNYLDIDYIQWLTGEAAEKASTVRAFTRRHPVRNPFPDHLPRERVVVEAPAACTCCGSDRIVKMGEE